MSRLFTTLAAAALAVGLGSGCGDDCGDRAVDAFGFCAPDGRAYQLADAVVGGIIVIAADLPSSGTSPCPGGGQVTVARLGSAGPMTDTQYTFNNCAVEHNEAEGLIVRYASGSLRDTFVYAVGSTTTFSHHVVGTAAVGAEVLIKAQSQELAPRECAMDVQYVSQLLGDTAITGTICGETIQRPLYE